jgi:hypothetical protein
MNGILHPECGTRFPASERTGHCGNCCRTFYGLAAFDQHQSVTDGSVRCSDPSADTVTAKGEPKPWWLDDKDRWHYGERLTEEQKQKMGWTNERVA